MRENSVLGLVAGSTSPILQGYILNPIFYIYLIGFLSDNIYQAKILCAGNIYQQVSG